MMEDIEQAKGSTQRIEMFEESPPQGKDQLSRREILPADEKRIRHKVTFGLVYFNLILTRLDSSIVVCSRSFAFYTSCHISTAGI